MKHLVFCRGESAGLQRLGRVLHVTPSRDVVVKVETPPKTGDRVVDEKLKPVGVVFDVFGPVSSPYVAVKPTVKDPKALVNQTLYVVPSSKHVRKGKETKK